MNATYPHAVLELWVRCESHAASERYRLLREVLSFAPAEPWHLTAAVGEVRSQIADLWERQTGGVIPFLDVSRIISDRTQFTVRARLWDVAESATRTEFASAILSLLRELDRQLRLAKDRQLSLFDVPLAQAPPTQRSVTTSGSAVGSLHDLVASGQRFSTIYADPPWPYSNAAARGAAANHYPVMPLKDIFREPVGELVADNAHLHLWTTTGFLREALDLIAAWGFIYKSCFVWLKPELGCGNYWRVSHEFLLLGVRGSLTFRDRTLPSWLIAPRLEHSRKPGRVRLLIEQVSPGPFLELYGRAEIPDADWTVYGNQVARRLF